MWTEIYLLKLKMKINCLKHGIKKNENHKKCVNAHFLKTKKNNKNVFAMSYVLFNNYIYIYTDFTSIITSKLKSFRTRN